MNLTKHAVQVLADRRLLELEQADAERARRWLATAFLEAHPSIGIPVVENVAAKYADCPHVSLSGDEGPIDELGRWPLVWKCDSCGARIHEAAQ